MENAFGQSVKRCAVRCLQWLEGPSQILWPNACSVCHQPILPADDRLCRTCWQEISEAVASDYCRRCGRDVSPFGIVAGRCGACRDLELPWDGIVRVGSYADAFRTLILSLKFSERTEWADRLALMLRDATLAGGLADQVDFLVPVPLHWRRRLGRGFNQSKLLAQRMKLDGPAVQTDLVRIRYTEQQWNLTGPQRRRNVKGAFAVRRGHPFEGKSILLVDDITTSGATLAECSKVLKDAGAKQVFVAVLAAAYKDHP
jgi:competence protein ComFC